MGFPVGYSAARAIAQVQTRTNERVTPPATNNNNPDDSVVGLLNAALEEVGTRLGPVKWFNSVPVVAGSAVTPLLLEDIQEIISISYSTTSDPSNPSAIVYQMRQLDPEAFFDQTGNQPTSGNGIPTFYYIKSDASNQLVIEVWPPPSANGFYYVFYKQRPVLWGTSSSALDQASTTQVDSAWQELAILKACSHVCYANEKIDLKKEFDADYKELLEEYRERLMRRARPKGSIVRDVRNGPFDPRPIWWG